MAELAGQFGAALEAALAARRVPLARLAERLGMAAWLLALRARLLLPADPGEGAAAERDAARRLADWLERRLQLGREVFGRGAAAPETLGPPRRT